MPKIVKAVQPYIYPGQLNFKDKPFEAWKALGSETVKGWYPRFLHSLMFQLDVPTLWHGEARLCFVQPVSLYFDTFPYYATHEIIPFIWDCWPCYYDKMEKWLKRHKVRTAIFTSKQEMEEMKTRCPHVTMIWCPEAVDSSIYKPGRELKERNIDLLEFGRSNRLVVSGKRLEGINHVCTKVGNKFIYDNDQLVDAMGDAKITICLPKSMTHPHTAQGVETLTQRYWEAMLSRMVIVGHAPKELIEICGYNPVIDIHCDFDSTQELISDIITNIEDYQDLVDKNRTVALEKGDWNKRLPMLHNELKSADYII